MSDNVILALVESNTLTDTTTKIVICTQRIDDIKIFGNKGLLLIFLPARKDSIHRAAVMKQSAEKYLSSILPWREHCNISESEFRTSYHQTTSRNKMHKYQSYQEVN